MAYQLPPRMAIGGTILLNAGKPYVTTTSDITISKSIIKSMVNGFLWEPTSWLKISDRLAALDPSIPEWREKIFIALTWKS
jgi:hypothetical protein